ncbi:hypothetical protein C4585_00140 [Candidatus Parcubacteria bacterium]|nr:MAG: hypothetical protein C4585_00140 [Candidatus Parcubacteria bacterium]
MATFHLTIASVGETYFDGQATSATFPGAGGEFTMMAHHEPIVTTLKAGTITVRGESGSKEMQIKDGILECSNNHAVVLL